MKKYITPSIEVVELESIDIITTSTQGNAVTYAPLEGVDTEDGRSAIFDASFWTSQFGNK